MGLIYQTESNTILKLAYQLHNELGCGFKEKVYQDAFEVLLQENKIPYEREKSIKMVFHGVTLQHTFFFSTISFVMTKLGLK